MTQSRRRREPSRPQVEGLEGRQLLASAAQVHALGGILTFRAPNQGIFSQQATAATVTLKLDTGGQKLKAPVPVQVDTVEGPYGGTATPNQQYVPVHELLTFQTGQMTKTITVPIVSGAANPGQLTVALTATAQTANAISTTTKITLDSRDHVVPPQMLKWKMLVEKGKGRGIALTFNQPLDAATATNRKNYYLWSSTKETKVRDWIGALLTNGDHNPFKPVPVRIKAVEYDPATYTVTLRPKAVLIPGGQYDVTSGLKATKTGKPKPGGLTDAYGNLVGYFHVTLGKVNEANRAGAAAADVLNRIPHL